MVRGTKETFPQKQPLDVAAEIDTLCPKFCEPFADPNNLLTRTSTYNEVVVLDNTFSDITHGNPTHIKAIAYPQSCFEHFCLNASETATYECSSYIGNSCTTETRPVYTAKEVRMYKSLFTYIVNNKIPMVIVASETAKKAKAEEQEIRNEDKVSAT